MRVNDGVNARVTPIWVAGDVKLDGKFHRMKVSDRADQANFLTRVKEALA